MYRFIQNIGDYFNPGYFTEDFKSNVFGTSGYDSDAIKEFNKRFSGLRQKYFDYKQSIIEAALPMKYVLKHTHDFHTVLLEALGYDPREPYSQWLYLDDSRVVPVRHILKEGNQPQLLIMEMQPMIQRGENSKVEGLFEQQYSLPPDSNAEPARYRWNNWSLVDRHPIPEGCAISPKLINQAVEEIFYLPADQRPHYILMLAGNRVYLLEEKQFKRGSYLVFDLEELFAEVSIPANRDYYALFYLLCGKQSLAAEGQSTLMDRLEEESTKNAFSVTKDLKEGVIHAVEGLANEAIYYIHEVRNEAIDETDDAFEQNVKDDCITIVYRLLFIFYAEARPELGILPTDNEVYLNGYSLDKLRDLESVQMQKPATQNGYFIHDSLWRLFSMIHNGYNESLIRQTKEAKDENDIPLSRTFAVKKIDSPLFDDSKLKVLGGIKYRNFVWQRIIRELSLTKPDNKHKTIGRISYANLGINQLGSVYESLLAYRGFYAEQDYAEVFKAGAEKDGTYLVPASRLDDFRHDEIKFGPDGELFTIPKGTFIYRLNGRDRKMSASFYTPEVLTQSTVKYTLKGFVDRLKDDDDSFCAQDLLKLKILEPAMGAAAFQNEVINQLAELYISQREKELGKHVSPTSRRNEIQKVKAYIATHNVYGVDLNPTAIELGKLSLWLNVIHRDMETPFFSNRLAVGNAVIGAWLKVYSRNEVVGMPVTKNHKNTLAPNAWWEKAPHKVKFFKNRVNRAANDVYHFLLPDKNMLGVLKIAEQKKAHPNEVKHMNKILKDWTAPLKSEEFAKLQRLSDKIDLLLKEYLDFQQSLEALTNNKTELWGVFGQTTMQYDKAENYAEKERLNDTRYRHDNAYFRLKMVMDYWCALWFWDYDHADELPTREEYWSDINAMLNVSDEAINQRTRQALKQKVYVDGKGQLGLFPEGHMNDMFYQQQLESSVHEDLPNTGSTPCANAEAVSCAGPQEMTQPLSDEETSETIIKSKQEILTEVKGDVRTIFDDSMRFKYVKQLADRYHFFHPMLEFIEVFWLRDGFDIICGNPPWIKLEFDERGIISERFPEVEIRNISSPDVRKMRDRLFAESPEVEKLYHEEEAENAGDAAFMNAYCNYPLLIGQQTNLYKCVLENGIDELSHNGFMGMLHPESIYDDPNGQPLRREVYHHLRYHFQYENELNLFAGTNDHGRMKFGENIYGPYQQEVHFASISNLFTPSTVDGCFAHDGHGICGGIKDENGKWNTKAHNDRVVWFREKELQILSDTFENGTPWDVVKLVSIHTQEIIDVLDKISKYPTHVKDKPNIITECLHETGAVDAGIIKRYTKEPDFSKYEMVYSGPIFYVSNPLYKEPKKDCKLNSDYDAINLSGISADFFARTNYVPIIPIKDYVNLFKGFPKQNADRTTSYGQWIDYYKIGFRKMVGSAAERTLICAVLPRRTAHINGVISISFLNRYDAVDMAALCAATIMDFYMKTLGVSNVQSSRMQSFPIDVAPIYKNALYSRTLLLNCLTQHYADLWQDCWNKAYKDEHWSISDPRLKPFSGLTETWTWETPLRNYFERRQALVEIDVIAAMALGLSLKDLEMIYSIQFPVLQQNEGDTWYDQKGNIVFTCSKGLTGVGCDRPEWNAIRGTVSADGNSYDGNGEPYTHTIDPKKSELYGGQQVAYYPPYTRPDRIQDYRRAWAFFEKRFNDLM